ncbi:hypothetical protein BDV96DRAFT_339262 [Lophiotrema nucula]|uniref:Uncharacterized protein n=1 Tax=Lophiotrema nucula TaxID=690887 RepID=A0A6A5YGJ2_9PLEO|nr:hypothetical protein BDV96DRAFT_339262 [Lophiotrema nucula]
MEASTAAAIQIALIVLSAASFWPQYCRILTLQQSVGISPYYVLLNLISATEQLALGLYLAMSHEVDDDGMVRFPLPWGRWLNLAHFAVVCICQLVLIIMCLLFPSHHPWTNRTVVVAIYVGFALVSLGPVILELLPPPQSDPLGGRRWFSAFVAVLHVYLLGPVVTLLAFVALFPQIREIRTRPGPSVLSPLGLAIQALLFAVVALSWLVRMVLPIPLESIPWDRLLHVLVVWYQLVGWAAVDNFAYAFVQTVLWVVEKAHRMLLLHGDETAPLIDASAAG